jgi:hypothetical protein
VLAVLSALVALGCILASARRFAWVVAPTALDAHLLLDAMRGDGASERMPALLRTLTSLPSSMWEHDLGLALSESDPRSRDALVVEQLLELDWRAQRWARVPRVCASIATSAGFFFGSIALLEGLALPAPDAGAALFAALNALTIGIAGTSFCVAVHLRARRLIRERVADHERLVRQLEEWAGEEPAP